MKATYKTKIINIAEYLNTKYKDGHFVNIFLSHLLEFVVMHTVDTTTVSNTTVFKNVKSCVCLLMHLFIGLHSCNLQYHSMQRCKTGCY